MYSLILHVHHLRVQGHDARCTEKFYETQVRAELKVDGVDLQDKKRMLGLLSRAAEDDERNRPVDPLAALKKRAGAASSGEHNDTLAAAEQASALNVEDTARLEQLERLAQSDDPDALSLEALTLDEREAFLRAVSSAPQAVASGIAAWRPWWEASLAEHSAAAKGPLIRELSKEGAKDAKPAANNALAAVCIDAATNVDRASIPTFPSLTRGAAPSPLLPVLLVDLLYAYAHMTRLYAGDWRDDPGEAGSMLLAVSQVLSVDARPATVPVCVTGVMQAALQPGVRLTSTLDRAVAYGVLHDTSVLLSERHFVVDALWDAHRCVIAAIHRIEASVKNEQNKVPNSSSSSKAAIDPRVLQRQRRSLKPLQAAARKLTYYLSWIRDDDADQGISGTRNATLLAVGQEIRQLLTEHADLMQQQPQQGRRDGIGGVGGAKVAVVG